MSSLKHSSHISTSARASSFVAACAVALVSGTPYLYSTYANQLTTKLELTAIQSNVTKPVANDLRNGACPDEFHSNPSLALIDRRRRRPLWPLSFW